MQKEGFPNRFFSKDCRLLAVGCVAAASREKRAKKKWPPCWGDVVARRTRPRTMLLATMTIKTQTLGFAKFYPKFSYGVRSAALRAVPSLF